MAHRQEFEMALNIEAKVQIDDLPYYISLLKNMSKTEGIGLNQRDVFFNVESGALKYRQENDNHECGALIRYNRDYSEFPFVSRYMIEKITKEQLDRIQDTHGVKSIVKKKRLLFMVDNARVHLDDVHNLGTFLEIELVKSEEQIAEGRESVRALFNKLGLKERNILYSTYESMLAKLS